MRATPRPLTGVLAAAVLLTALLTACGSGGADSNADQSGTYPVTHEYGTVQVPNDPERIVVLDEYAALILTSLGITPDTVYQALGSEIAPEVLDIELTPAPTIITSPNLERIAAERPDLIVLTDTGATLQDTFPRFNTIAPTVVLPYEEPWREVLSVAAGAFNKTERAQQIVSTLDARIAQLEDAIPSPAPSISVLGFVGASESAPFSLAPINPVSRLLASIGFTRPPAEATAESTAGSTSTIVFSPENLGQHNADTIVVLGGSVYDADAITDIPTFPALRAARAGRVAVGNGEMWTGSFPFAVWWVLEDIDALLSNDFTLGAPSNAQSRFDAFQHAISTPQPR